MRFQTRSRERLRKQGNQRRCSAALGEPPPLTRRPQHRWPGCSAIASCPPNERQEPSRRVNPAPIDRARRRGRPVQSVAESVSLFRESQYLMKDSTMRIAQIAPLYESVPPKLYGGTERVVACLS